MSSINDRITYRPGEVIVSIGFYSIKDLEYLYKLYPPSYCEAYEPRQEIYNQYVIFSKKYSSFIPRAQAVAGDEKQVPLTTRRCNTTIVLPKTKATKMITTVSLKNVIQSMFNIHGGIDRLLMNCEGSEIDIIKKTPSDVLGLCRNILVSFHLFVNDFNISDKDYKICLKKLSLTHTGELLHKTRFWWNFNKNG